MSRELDAKVAEALGLDVVGESRCWFIEGEWEIRDGWPKDRADDFPLRPLYVSNCICDLAGAIHDRPMFGHYWGCLDPVACYSTDIAAATKMEDTLEGDSQSDYVFALSALVTRGVPYPPQVWAWRMRSATPEQRCRAFLKAVEE